MNICSSLPLWMGGTVARLNVVTERHIYWMCRQPCVSCRSLWERVACTEKGRQGWHLICALIPPPPSPQPPTLCIPITFSNFWIKLMFLRWVKKNERLLANDKPVSCQAVLANSSILQSLHHQRVCGLRTLEQILISGYYPFNYSAWWVLLCSKYASVFLANIWKTQDGFNCLCLIWPFSN